MALTENHANRLAGEKSAAFAQLRGLHGLQSFRLQNRTEGLAGFGVRSDDEDLFVVHVKLLGTIRSLSLSNCSNRQLQRISTRRVTGAAKLFTQLLLIMMRNCDLQVTQNLNLCNASFTLVPRKC